MSSQKIIISKSSNGLKPKFLAGALILFCLCILITFLFKSILGFGTRIEAIMIYLVWLCSPLFWTLWVATEYRTFKNSKYYLTSDSLIISKRNWRSQTKKYFRFDTIKSVTVSTNNFLNNSSNGTIILTFLDSPKVLTLRQIKNPDKYVKDIKKKATINKTIIK